MNQIERFFNKAANTLGIYPHEGKKIIFIRHGELHKGEVIGSAAFTGHTPLTRAGSIELMNIRNEAAEALKTRKAVISRRLHRGEMVLYRAPSK